LGSIKKIYILDVCFAAELSYFPLAWWEICRNIFFMLFIKYRFQKRAVIQLTYMHRYYTFMQIL